jgi:DNA-binding NarL/FixJ family response regulator
MTLRTGDRATTVRYLPASADGPGDRLLLESGEDDGLQRARARGLTPREAEILSLVRVGMTNRQIADALVLAPTTVRRHLENVFAKLDVRTRTGAVAAAFG